MDSTIIASANSGALRRDATRVITNSTRNSGYDHSVISTQRRVKPPPNIGVRNTHTVHSRCTASIHGHLPSLRLSATTESGAGVSQAGIWRWFTGRFLSRRRR